MEITGLGDDIEEAKNDATEQIMTEHSFNEIKAWLDFKSEENIPTCEGCDQEFEESELNEDSLCEECYQEQGQNKEESKNDLD